MATRSTYIDPLKIVLPQKTHVHIVHATQDTTIPLADSEELVKRSQSKLVRLTVVDDDHRLTKYGEEAPMKEFITDLIARLMTSTFLD